MFGLESEHSVRYREISQKMLLLWYFGYDCGDDVDAGSSGGVH